MALGPAIRRRWGRLTALTALLGVGVALAVSPSLRIRTRAAARAFGDPSIVDAPAAPPAPPGRLELEQPDLGGDLDRLASTDSPTSDAGIAGFAPSDLPIAPSARTLRFVDYFSASPKGRAAFTERYKRAGRYGAAITQALRDRDLPEDLVWMVGVLSDFNPQATSARGATGMFQLTPEVAQRYSLAVSEEVDERRSLTRGTAAGVARLADLFARYHAWDLALAAYDLGEDKLDAALDRLRSKRSKREQSKPIALAELAEARLVPKETANLVPQIQALGLVAQNRGRFGLDDLDRPAPLELGDLAVPGGTPLKVVAKAAGVSLAVVRDCNPGLLGEAVPAGGDALVSLPADKVAAALAAFPALLAREKDRDAERLAAASALASDGAPAASASASARAEPPPDRFTLASGVVVELRAAPGGDVVLGAKAEPAGARPGAKAAVIEPVSVPANELSLGLVRAAEALRKLASGAGEASVAARRKASTSARRALENTPYGAAWIALSEHLFPAGSPLAGTVLAAPAMPLSPFNLAEAPAPPKLAFTVAVTGPVDRATLSPLAERAFVDLVPAPVKVGAPSSEERVALTAHVAAARAVFGWLIPVEDEGTIALLRLTSVLLSDDEVGVVHHTLVSEKHVAAHARAILEIFPPPAHPGAAVLAVELVPAVSHDVASVERELDQALGAFASRGPSADELAVAKAHLRARIAAEKLRASATPPRLDRLQARAEAATAPELQALVKEALAKEHRVVVTTTPP